MQLRKLTWSMGMCLLVVVGMILIGCQQKPAPTPQSGDKEAAPTTTDATADNPGATTDESTAKADGSTTKADVTEFVVPLGLPPVPVPADNPMSVDKVELGKMLYFDTRLSKDGTVSCATCHDPKTAWTQHTPTSKGIGGQLGGANSPTVINSAYAPALFWDGRAASLEAQALGPIENPVEMGHKLPDMVAELNKLDGYKTQFQKVFSTDVTADGVAKAIAAFERTVLSGNSPYDKFKAGDAKGADRRAETRHGFI